MRKRLVNAFLAMCLGLSMCVTPLMSTIAYATEPASPSEPGAVAEEQKKPEAISPDAVSEDQQKAIDSEEQKEPEAKRKRKRRKHLQRRLPRTLFWTRSRCWSMAMRNSPIRTLSCC